LRFWATPPPLLSETYFLGLRFLSFDSLDGVEILVVRIDFSQPVEFHEQGIIGIDKIDILLAVANQGIGNDGFIDNMKVGAADGVGNFFDYFLAWQPWNRTGGSISARR
jgi:hypothetical protein